MSILEKISSPADLRTLTPGQLETLAGEIREFLIEKVSATGGHLGPNLGVVELTIALHRVFDSPADPLIFDTGHQSYVHKILTGRRNLFDTLRQRDGLSGYPDRAESPHDWTESSHASASLSYADGLAKAFELTGQSERRVAAVIGDGALTGGMAWEALNNIAEGKDRPLTVIVNDNGRSYSPTIGGLAHSLAGMRMQPAYDKVMEQGKNSLGRLGAVGEHAFKLLHSFKEGVKHAVIPQELFSNLGLKYVGPVDGHDVRALVAALSYARDYGGPIIVHTVTKKGNGYAPAENDEADQMHSTGVIDPVTGRAVQVSARGWTDVFAEELIEIGRRRDDVVAITAAMAGPTGLSRFAEVFPERTFDVGIAEQHAVTSAAGLALGGLHPVVAVYSTFLNRAFDQMLMDVALLHMPVTFVLDRAGITGSDGASHNGMWDLSITGVVPGIRVAAPRDGARLVQALDRCVEVSDGPSVVRFSKGAVPEDVEAVESFDDFDVLAGTAGTAGADAAGQDAPSDGSLRVLVVNYGPLTAQSLAAAEALVADGHRATVIDPVWVTPVASSVVDRAREADLVVTVEDNGVHGGAGQMLARAASEASVSTPVRYLGVDQRFLAHGSRNEVLAEVGLDTASVVDRVRTWAAQEVQRRTGTADVN
ncbi:1-deoxy-D-xylulose-5-phosphate synthase [Corynebacterium kalidii]|uniref:1-deoxy-D-xylulose-5-phosphate synthase n=1 Tax=Corynebacterium kalidii TaxID=2931982 RepID=A0A9X2AZY3_9CORY|nr:1-deoxy-D-xylulose-5-phosphate synthase [Corynebacterium kalidii]MCJ7859586.1 1-deoxy-D-xylulose-5-phosphate synthase [Corynebacterium kalidii]